MSTIRGTSSSWREWTILYEDLKFPDGSLLGKGRFGEVHRAYWHQDVAIKLLNMDHVNDDRQLETFKQEVSTFRHTRHENLVLFVGCCLIPPRLGIVMNLCKGQTLYTHIHWRRDRFDMNKIINIAIQLCQGMSYLHGKKIVHKDFRTKNIFVEANNKPVITDFSIFSVKRLCQTSPHDFDIKGLYVPERWLCYLSPELSRMLKTWTSFQQVEELPFNEASDVYSFGTVWYELLTYEFPYKKLFTDAIIWQCCKGIKPGLTNLTVAKEIKDVLVQCWTYKPGERPNFHQLLKTFEKLPRKRLERSPSQPVHLSRSAESIF
uniref:Protein kinase domain-containing protein n=1 Tax=Romanomermis culicivorax TaxID=13658 RepID=A0A915JS36_ROMCU